MKKLFLALLALTSPAAAQTLPNVTLVFEPFHASGIYGIGERAGLGWKRHAISTR